MSKETPTTEHTRTIRLTMDDVEAIDEARDLLAFVQWTTAYCSLLKNDHADGGLYHVLDDVLVVLERLSRLTSGTSEPAAATSQA